MPVSKPAHTMPFKFETVLADQLATHQLADAFSGVLQPGDTLLLDGPIGAGKTTFARALITRCLALAGAPPEDIPSPTFTLVQTYIAGAFEIWHADLYRLTHPDEVLELGLEEAFSTAVCLIEWPDRLGNDIPEKALRLSFKTLPKENARGITIEGPICWQDRLSAVRELFDA